MAHRTIVIERMFGFADDFAFVVTLLGIIRSLNKLRLVQLFGQLRRRLLQHVLRIDVVLVAIRRIFRFDFAQFLLWRRFQLERSLAERNQTVQLQTALPDAKLQILIISYEF